MADTKKQTVPGLRIRAVPENGFCRAGRRWPREAQDVPLTEFDKKQLAALRAEPMLVVIDVEIDLPEDEA